MEKLSRRSMLRSLPAVAGLIAVPAVAEAALHMPVTVHDPLIDLIAERAALRGDMSAMGIDLEDDDPIYDEYDNVWERLCAWGPAATAAGATAALQLAMDDMEDGPGKLSRAMIRSAMDNLEGKQRA